MIKRLLFSWLLALLSCSAWAALSPELLARIAAGEGDERVAALNEAVAQGDPALANYLHALLDGRVRLREGKVVVTAEGGTPPEGEEPMLNNRLRREIDAALAGLDLLSTDRATRAKALVTLREDASAAKLPLYERALAAEKDAELRSELGALVAGAKLSSTDPGQRRAAATELAGSADP
ncbi:MAG: urea ABC transporter permease subunit UrtB, partial [Burkholderiales bacterium]|nr:urea ABC transporter permease subunit UrtB [Burkholderiales bacterium]